MSRLVTKIKMIGKIFKTANKEPSSTVTETVINEKFTIEEKPLDIVASEEIQTIITIPEMVQGNSYPVEDQSKEVNKRDVVIVNLEKQISDLRSFLIRNSIGRDRVEIIYPFSNSHDNAKIIVNSAEYNFNKESSLFQKRKTLINFICQELKI